MENKLPSSPREALKVINILFYAMMTGAIFFAGIMYVLSTIAEPAITDKQVVRALLILILFVAALVFTLAERFYKKRIAEVCAEPAPLMKKLDALRAGLMVYMAFCEGIGCFAMILFFLTGSMLFLVVTFITLAGMLIRRPVKSKIFNELQLSSEEQMELN